MSKKSRKRNKRILGALGALGLGLALANRGKGTEMSNISVGGGKDAATMKTGTGKTIMDNMPVKDSIVKNVARTTNLGRMEGSGPTKGEIGQDIRANYAKKMRNLDADIKRNNMLRAIRSNVDIATTPDSILQGVPQEALMAKDGGKIVKGEKKAVRPKKKTRIQIRGFGKARR